MNEEETLANAALCQAYGDDQLQELRNALLSSIAPERMVAWLGMMLPALNVHERIGRMGGMKATAPAAAFENTMMLGRQVVGEPWAAVEAALARQRAGAKSIARIAPAPALRHILTGRP